MDRIPPGSVRGILQAGILEWLPCLLPRDLAHQGITAMSPAAPVLQAGGFFTSEPLGSPFSDRVIHLKLKKVIGLL